MTAHWPDWPLFNLNFNEDVFWQVNQQCILDECHIYLATQSYSSPPCFPASTGPLEWARRQRGKACCCIQPSIDYLRLHTRRFMHVHTRSHPSYKHRCGACVCRTAHNPNIPFLASPWIKRKSKRRKSQDFQQLDCLVAHGDNIWERRMWCLALTLWRQVHS